MSATIAHLSVKSYNKETARKTIGLNVWALIVLLQGVTTIRSYNIGLISDNFVQQEKSLNLEQEGPRFLHEPPNQVDFSSSVGVVIPCSASGNPPPQIGWEYLDGSIVKDIPGLRTLRDDGSLVFLPFELLQYNQEVHGSVYRCVAVNFVGQIQSRNVHVRAVVHQNYKLQVNDDFAIKGNSAVLKCHMPAFVKEFIKIISWSKNDQIVNAPPSSSSLYLSKENRHHILLSTGELLIPQLSQQNVGTYACQARDTITNAVLTSDGPGRLRVTEPSSDIFPRITFKSNSVVKAQKGTFVELVCVAEAFPLPVLSWFKEDSSIIKSLSTVKADEHISFDGGLLLINNVQLSDAGIYYCEANNTVGKDRQRIHLVVRHPLVVQIHPSKIETDFGRSVLLNCSIQGFPIGSIVWLKDRRPIMMNSLDGRGYEEHLSKSEFPSRIQLLQRNLLNILAVTPTDSGMYQCVVSNEYESVQASAELKIRGVEPTIISDFPDSAFEPGSFVSLKCSATGSPTPEINWMLDDSHIPKEIRFHVGDYVTSSGEVVSFVNISNVRVTDGGDYRCVASNAVGKVVHNGRLNVFGPPTARVASSNITVIAGRKVILRCPVKGYPIDFLKWEHNGHLLPMNHRQKVEPLNEKGTGGSLKIDNVQRPADEGKYICTVTGSEGKSVKGTIGVAVKVAPQIDTQLLSEKIFTNEGMRLQLVCSVIQGDPPVQIGWIKNGIPLVTSRHVFLQNSEDYSIITFKKSSFLDRGNYTCEAFNEVGTTNRTTQLTVNVPPKWKVEPRSNLSVILGKEISIDCSADGYPQPRIIWKSESKKQSLDVDFKNGHQTDFRDILPGYKYQVLTNGTLVIQEAEKSDAGHYMCEVSNGIGAGLSKMVFITVNVPPYFDTKFLSLAVRRNHSSTLRCEAHGDTPMTILWLKDKQPIDTLLEKRFIVKEEPADRETLVSILEILSTTQRDSGLYTCEAKNQFGFDQTSIQVVVQEPPGAPSNLEVKDKSSRSAWLSWKAPFSGNSPITSYILEYKDNESIDSGKWMQMKTSSVELKETLTNLNPVTKYQVRVIASNTIGDSEPSLPVSFETKEEAPGGPPLNVTVEASGAQSLKVRWRSPKAELCHGKIRGYYVGYRALDHEESFNYKNVEVLFSSNPDVNINSKPETLTNEEITSFITNLQRRTTYEIIVQAYNSVGTGPRSDYVRMTTLETAPPTSPSLALVHSTSDGLTVKWESNKNDVDMTYVLYFRPDNSESWSKVEVGKAANNQYQLRNLKCGSKYQLYMTAANSLGTSEPSETLFARTTGAAPLSPSSEDFIQTNHSSVILKLNKWTSGGCPIKFFSVKYKPTHQDQWIILNSDVPATQSRLLIGHLIPGISYNAVVSAYSDVGTTEAEYTFKTLNKINIPLTVQHSISATNPINSQASIVTIFGKYTALFSVSVSIIFLVFVLGLLMFYIRKQEQSFNGETIDTSSNLSVYKADLHHESVSLREYQQGRYSYSGGNNDQPVDGESVMISKTCSQLQQAHSCYGPVTSNQMKGEPIQFKSYRDYAEPYSRVDLSKCLTKEAISSSENNLKTALVKNVSQPNRTPDGQYATIEQTLNRKYAFNVPTKASIVTLHLK